MKVIDANNVNTAFVEAQPSEVALIAYTYDELNRHKQTDPDNNYRSPVRFYRAGRSHDPEMAGS